MRQGISADDQAIGVVILILRLIFGGIDDADQAPARS